MGSGVMSHRCAGCAPYTPGRPSRRLFVVTSFWWALFEAICWSSRARRRSRAKRTKKLSTAMMPLRT
eukprot:5667832-Pyramimonas_sp.AAC.1